MNRRKSIEKNNFERLKKEKIPFLILHASVAQTMINPYPFLIWAYLSSLPEDWIINRSHLKSHFKIGETCLKKALAFLSKSNLIDYVQEKDSSGKFSPNFIRVRAGWDYVDLNQEEITPEKEPKKSCAIPAAVSNFNPPAKLRDLPQKVAQRKRTLANSANSKKIKTNENNDIEDTVTAGSLYHPTVYPEGARSTLQNNTNINTKKTKKISCAPTETRDKFFDKFYSLYPRKRDPAKARKIWERKGYDDLAEQIIADVQRRIGFDSQWRDVQFVPYPSTYLNNKRWEDEITEDNVRKINGTRKESAAELTSRVLKQGLAKMELNHG